MFVVRRQRRNAVTAVLFLAAVAGLAIVLGVPAQTQPLHDAVPASMPGQV